MRFFEIMIALVVPLGGFAVSNVGECDVDWDNEQNVTDNLNLDVTCGETSITVSIDTCILKIAGYDVSKDITINGDSNVIDSCVSLTPTVSGSIWEVTMNHPWNTCNTQSNVSADDSTIYYSNSVSVFQFSDLGNATITRMRDHYLPFVCEYVNKYDAVGLDDSPTHYIVPSQIPQTAVEESVTGSYDYDIRGCRDEACSTGNVIMSGESVLIPLEIYIVITTTRDVFIYVWDVIAQNNASSPDVTYTIAGSDGCLTNVESADGTTIDTFNNGTTVICLRLFRWGGAYASDSIYFRVTFSFCDPDSSQDCSLAPCSGLGRRRRAAPSQSDHTTTTEILGPWRVV